MSGYHHRDDIDEVPEHCDITDGAMEYGICQSRRSTNYYHRNSSSLTPIQMMTQEICYNTAENFHWHSIIIARLIACLLVIYNRLNTTLSAYHHLATENIMARDLRDKIQKIVKRLHLIMK